jgi:hypothetical protein
MANFTVTLRVGVAKGAAAQWTTGIGGLSSGDPIDVQIGDTVTFTRDAANSNGTAKVRLLNIFTSNADIDLTAASPTVVRTVASGGTTLDTISGLNQGESVTDDLFIERQAAVTVSAPTASSVTFNNPASANTTATVNLSASGSGGTLQYALSLTDSTPDNWQSGSTFTVSRGSGTVYARARRSSTTNSNVVTATRPGFLIGDTGVSPSSTTITHDATTASTVVTYGTYGEAYSVRVNNGSTNLGATIANSVGTATISFTSSLPSVGSSTTYEIFVRRPTSTGGDGSTYYPTDDTFTVTRSALAPTASSVTFNNPASTSITATVNLSASGSGGTLQYALSLTDSTPDNWQSGSTFTISRGTGTVYARARRSSTLVSNVVSATRPPFLIGDTGVNPSSTTIGYSDTSEITTVAFGTAGETYAVRLNNGSTNLGTALAPAGNPSTISISFSTSLPTAGNTTTYEIFVRRPTSTGGDGSTYYPTDDTFTVTRDSLPVSPVVNNTQTFATTGSSSTSCAVSLTSNGSGGTLQYNKSTSTTVPTSGWQSSATVTGLTRGTAYYLWARQATGYQDRTNTALTVPFLIGDTGVSPSSSTIAWNDTTASTVVTFGTYGEAYSARVNNGSTNLGATIANSVGTATISFTSSLPTAGNSTTYEIFVRRPTSTGGDGSTYHATNDTFTVARSVQPDTTAPVITVTSGTDTVERGGSWTDAGATANGGETVTSSGTVNTSVVGTYTITYSATDSSNNTGTATRTVTIVDTTAPIITRLGSATVTLNVGGTYSDAGATAVDNNGDGTITSSIVTVNPVNVNAAGTYTVTYNVSDSAGNAATQVTRSVTVYAVPDITITDILNKTESAGSTTFTVTIAAGSSTTIYEVKDYNTNPATGTVHASQTGNGTMTVSDMPSSGAAKSYMVTGRLPVANGGDNTPSLADTFEVFLEGASGSTTGGGGSGTYGIEIRNASNEIILDLTDRVVIFRERVTGSIPAADLTKTVTLSGNGTCALNLSLPQPLQTTVSNVSYTNTHLIVWATISGTALTIHRKSTQASNNLGSTQVNELAPYDFLVLYDPET